MTEMSIVDTLAKLIFGEESGYDRSDLQIIEVLRIVESNVSLGSHIDMGVYLRALGVQEMIKLVSSVRRAMLNGTRRDIAFRPLPVLSGRSHSAH
ncbi:MAG: hypothetical protein ACJAUG_001950 [Halioglobus sp.]|jgi:hypothetical protein